MRANPTRRLPTWSRISGRDVAIPDRIVLIQEVPAFALNFTFSILIRSMGFSPCNLFDFARNHATSDHVITDPFDDESCLSTANVNGFIWAEVPPLSSESINDNLANAIATCAKLVPPVPVPL